LVCGTDLTCHGNDLCNPGTPGASTLGCFQQHDKVTSAPGAVCTACATANGCFDPTLQGGTCELTTGTGTHFAGTLPDGTTCSQVFSGFPATETNICLDTLDQIFLSKCAATLQETPCLCGTTPAAVCLGGQATPTGSAFDIYACDFDTTTSSAIQTISTYFTVPTFGAGQANSLVQCAAAYGCDCF
jgi:hypothetical protein